MTAPETTRVVNINSGASFTVYIGRFHRSSRYGFWPRSRWANRFKIGEDATDAADAVEQYRAWLKTQPQLMGAIPTLRGQVLGCWCAPGPCHGDVLVELADG
jgi:hypothetical protein